MQLYLTPPPTPQCVLRVKLIQYKLKGHVRAVQKLSTSDTLSPLPTTTVQTVAVWDRNNCIFTFYGIRGITVMTMLNTKQ